MTATAITINEGELTMNTMHHTESSVEPTTATVSTDGEPVAVLDETPTGTRLAGRRRFARSRASWQRSC